MKERIVELETLLEVKQSGRLKHLPFGDCGGEVTSNNSFPANEEPHLYLCNESHLEELDDYIDFDCDFDCETVVGDNHNAGFKTPEKYEEKPKQASVRSFVLRLKRKERVQKDDSVFVYYMRDKKKVEKEKEDVLNEVEQDEDKLKKENMLFTQVKTKEIPSFDLNIDEETQPSIIELYDKSNESHDEPPNKQQFASMKSMEGRMKYLEGEDREVVERFFRHANKRYVMLHTLFLPCFGYM